MKKFTEFLYNMREFDPILIEAVEKGFNMIYESTEDIVEDVKKKVGTGEDTSDDFFAEEPSSELELDEFSEEDEMTDEKMDKFEADEFPEEELRVIS